MNDRSARFRLAVALAVLLVVAVVADRTASSSATRVPRVAPGPAAQLARHDVRSAAWYCPLAAPRTGLDGRDAVFVANTGSHAVTVEISGLGGGLRRAVRRVQVAPGRTLPFPASVLLGAHGQAVLVEPFGPGIVVEHRVGGTATADLAPCATALRGAWYFPALTTRRGATSTVALFNPLARTDVVVDVTLYTPSGERRPSALQGLDIPRRSRVLVTANTYADREPVLALSVRARAGGRLAAEAALAIGPAVAVSLGVAQPADRFWFASGIRAPRMLYVLNPGDSTAAVAVQIVPVGSQQTVPVSVRVNGGTVAAIDLMKYVGRREYSLLVGAPATTPVVVGDIEQRHFGAESNPSSLSSEPGVAAPSRTWALVFGLTGGYDTATLDVLDPGAASAHVTIRAGAPSPLTLTVAPGDRATVGLPAGAVGPIVVESDQPVIVDRILHRARPPGATRTGAVPGP